MKLINFFYYSLFSTAMLLSSCQKDLGNELSDQSTDSQYSTISNEAFLSDNHARLINNEICLAPGDTSNSEAINYIKNHLSEVNNNNPGTLEEFENIFGYPVWDANIIGSESNGSEWYMIPTVIEGQSSTHSLLVARRLPNNDYDINFYKRYDVVQHLLNPNISSNQLVNDIYYLFGICDCKIFCNVVIDSFSVPSKTTLYPRNEIITITWIEENNPEEFCEEGYHTETKTFFSGCSGGGGSGGSGNSGAGIGGEGGVFWGGGTGSGGVNPGNGGNSSGGGGGSNVSVFGESCIPDLEIVNYFDLLVELEGFIVRNNIQFDAFQLIEFINPTCLNDLPNFDQCVLDHLECLALELGNSLGLTPGEKSILVQNPTSILLSVINFLRNESYSEEAKSYIAGVLKLMDEDPLFIVDRFLELFYLYQSDNEFLTRNCLENNEPLWDDLMYFVPPQNVLDRLEDLGEGWRLQPLETPSSAPSINFDYFSVVINQMPINPSTGMQYSHEDFLEYIRKNIRDFTDPSLGEFNPLTPNDATLWQSSNLYLQFLQ